MKWFIVVLFMLDPGEPATADRSVYVFTDPTYESQDYCEASITDPQYYPILVEKLLQEYKYPKKTQITAVARFICTLITTIARHWNIFFS